MSLGVRGLRRGRGILRPWVAARQLGRPIDRRGGWAVGRLVSEILEGRLFFSAPTLPNVPNNLDVVVTAAPYNAVGNGTTDNATAINLAITNVSNAGGGTVEVPAASKPYEISTLTLKSNVILQIDSGAELQALAKGKVGTTAVISATGITNFEVIGEGSGSSQGHIDGDGSTWWPANTGPVLFQFAGCTQMLVQNVTLTNSPHYHLYFTGANDNVTINGITINTVSTSPNTDGIDPSGSNILIEGCTISDGDDNIALKPGGTPTSNITILNCTMNAGHGISIGSQTAGGLTNMSVNNVTFTNTQNGLRLKSGRGSGGLMQDITYTNITMTGVEYPILINDYYNQSNDFPTNPYADPGQAVTSLTPMWQNIVFENVTSTSPPSDGVGAAIYGLPEAPITNVQFINVKITAPTGMQIDHVRNFSFDANSHITATTGNDLIGTTSSSYPNPVDAQITAAGYTNADIGSPTVPFDTSESLYDPDSTHWVINGDGDNIGSTSDQFNFSYQPVTGSANFTAQLTALTGPGGGAVPQAGVMYRAATGATDPFAAVVQTTGNQVIFEWRTTAGGAMQSSAPIGLPVGSVYLQVQRSGSNFSGYYSTNGTNWTQIGSTVSIAAMPATANAGLAVTANDNGSTAAATFANVSVAVVVGPSITQAASAAVGAAGTNVALAVGASDPLGAGSLTYQWSATTVPNGVTAPTFDSNNGTNAGNNETATVYGTGSYVFLVTVTDTNNASTTSSTGATVGQVVTTLNISPATLSLPVNNTYQFSAAARDQFNNAIASPAVSWSVTGPNNSISANGLLSLGNPRNRAQVSATDDGVIGTAIVTPLPASAPQPPPVVTPIQTPAPTASGGTTGGGSAVSVPAAPLVAPVVTTTTPTSTPPATSTTLSAAPISSTVTSTGPAAVVTPPMPAAPLGSLQSWLQDHGFHGLALVAWHGIGWGW